MPDEALSAIIDTHKYIQKIGPFSGEINAWLTDLVKALKSAIANELKTTPETVTITENVTAGCNIALWGIEWQPGDRILMSDCEHPGIIATVEEIARRFGVEVAVCPIMATLNDGNPVEIIQDNLTDNTRLVVLSHLLWNTGQVLPLKDIARSCHNYQGKYKVRLMVDAAQSVGSLDLNLPDLEVDYYAFTGHKWLCGPAGVGGLYVSPEAFEELHPTFIGWRGVQMNQKGKPIAWTKDGTKYEVATSAYPEYEGLRNAISLHQSWGTSQERYQKICQNSQYLWNRLQEIDRLTCIKISPPEAGLVSFTVEGTNHFKLVTDLEKQGFLLRTIADPDCIRACVHYFTLTEECDLLITTIKNLI